ncbi:putative NADPH-cytochrome P450 reductase [Lipomyces orientalis]|uniref:NADPH-cytochrome P450 reductase n=1 Tax=Lipomyces orientalis TaxID=1233043 RepID=A0ACC3TFQ3_9ASCO
MEWKSDLFTCFREKLNYSEREVGYEPTITVIEVAPGEPTDQVGLGVPGQQRGSKNKMLAGSTTPICALTVKSSYELVHDSDRNCLHIELDISEHPTLKYTTGDHFGIWPTNPDIEVDRLLNVLGLSNKRESKIIIKELDDAANLAIPPVTTVEALFRCYLEISAVVPRMLLQSLAHFAPTNVAKNFVTHLSKDKDSYAKLQSKYCVNIGRLLEMASGGEVWHIPISFFIESVRPMQPRYYSIASSSVVQPREVAITVVISSTRVHEGSDERIFGLATNYLLAKALALGKPPQVHPHGLTYALDGPSNSLQGGKLYGHIRKSKFKLPISTSHAMIMFAAGTGIAPFRGFLHELARLKLIGRPIGKLMLFFGCRNENEDFLYKPELERLQQELEGNLIIVTAFSRPWNGEPKAYVQDRIDKHDVEICSMIDDSDVHIYICGSSQMAKAVSYKLESLVKMEKCWSEKDWATWIGRQRRTNRWQEDVWG